MTKKLFIKTHGCQMNEYDSAKMFDLLEEKEDFEIAESEDQADPVSYTHLTLPTK
mgnify:CR=1 FL=1